MTQAPVPRILVSEPMANQYSIELSRDEAAALQKKLAAEGIRAEVDPRNEKIGFKVREAQMQKVPYMIVLGDKEVEDKVVNLRDRKGSNHGVMSVEDMIAKFRHEIDEKLHD